MAKYTLIVVVPDWSYVEMRKFDSYQTVIFVSLLSLVLLSAGCGNKGDLFLEVDAATAEELKKAADKLKRSKKPVN